MSVAQIVLASLLMSLIFISSIVCIIAQRSNAKRKKNCTQKVLAKVVSVKHKGVSTPRYGLLSYYIVEYSFGNYDYKASLLEMSEHPQVGDAITIYVDPFLPENVYAGGAIENVERSIHRAAVIYILLITILLTILLFSQI